jgi:hypothetical protein
MPGKGTGKFKGKGCLDQTRGRCQIVVPLPVPLPVRFYVESQP